MLGRAGDGSHSCATSGCTGINVLELGHVCSPLFGVGVLWVVVVVVVVVVVGVLGVWGGFSRLGATNQKTNKFPQTDTRPKEGDLEMFPGLGSTKSISRNQPQARNQHQDPLVSVLLWVGEIVAMCSPLFGVGVLWVVVVVGVIGGGFSRLGVT